jgi:hypothetical protein
VHRTWAVPPNAAAFATDPRHYDPASEFCVKDLKVEQIEITDANAQVTMTIRFAFNEIPGVPRLTIVYANVIDFSLSADPDYYARADWIGLHTKRPSDVQLDEIMPHPHGCTHEIAMIKGTLLITCGDLVGTWEASQEFYDRG